MATRRLALVAAFVSLCLTACHTPMKQTPPNPPLENHAAQANTIADVAAPASAPQPPVAAKKPYQVPSPNGSREDEYYWLRDDKRQNPEMLAYVKAENAYADAMMAHTKALEETVYQEIIGRLKQD